MALDIQALIFDLDGVLTDTAEFHYLSWKRLSEEVNIPFTREDNELLRGVSRRRSLEIILKGTPIEEATAQDWMTRKNDYYLAYLDTLTPEHRLPGVTALLEQARAKGIKTAVASASRNANIVLGRLQLLDLFDVVGDGTCVVNTKPAPDIFLWVAGRLNVIPPRAVVIEDAEAGIDAALKGGFWTLGVGTSDVDHAHVRSQTLEQVSLEWLNDQLTQVANKSHE